MLRTFSGGEFCSDEHRRLFQDQQNDLALARLIEAQRSLEGTAGRFAVSRGAKPAQAAAKGHSGSNGKVAHATNGKAAAGANGKPAEQSVPMGQPLPIALRMLHTRRILVPNCDMVAPRNQPEYPERDFRTTIQGMRRAAGMQWQIPAVEQARVEKIWPAWDPDAGEESPPTLPSLRLQPDRLPAPRRKAKRTRKAVLPPLAGILSIASPDPASIALPPTGPVFPHPAAAGQDSSHAAPTTRWVAVNENTADEGLAMAEPLGIGMPGCVTYGGFSPWEAPRLASMTVTSTTAPRLAVPMDGSAAPSLAGVVPLTVLTPRQGPVNVKNPEAAGRFDQQPAILSAGLPVHTMPVGLAPADASMLPAGYPLAVAHGAPSVGAVPVLRGEGRPEALPAIVHTTDESGYWPIVDRLTAPKPQPVIAVEHEAIAEPEPAIPPVADQIEPAGGPLPLAAEDGEPTRIIPVPVRRVPDDAAIAWEVWHPEVELAGAFVTLAAEGLQPLDQAEPLAPGEDATHVLAAAALQDPAAIPLMPEAGLGQEGSIAAPEPPAPAEPEPDIPALHQGLLPILVWRLVDLPIAEPRLPAKVSWLAAEQHQRQPHFPAFPGGLESAESVAGAAPPRTFRWKQPPLKSLKARLASFTGWNAWSHAPADLKWVALGLPIILGLVLYSFRPAAPKGEAEVKLASGTSQSILSNQFTSIQKVINQRAAVHLMDDFRNGLSSWEGSAGWAQTWRYGQATFLEPGQLAFFKPTLSMRNYTFEFLGQIERRSLNWVVRALDDRNHHVMRLVITRPGPLPEASIMRYSVINGKQTEPVMLPLPFPIKVSTMYRVRVEVRDDEITTYVQGQLVDSFTDSRLKKGGVGFFCPKGDKSLLRWVEVTHQYDYLGRLCALFAPYHVQAGQAIAD